MASYSGTFSSESTNGLGIKISATGSPGTTIHTAVAGTTDYDEIWLWLVNTSATDSLVYVQWGGTTAVDNDIPFTVKARDGLKIHIPGLRLRNSLVVKAYADVTNVVVAYVNVNRVTA